MLSACHMVLSREPTRLEWRACDECECGCERGNSAGLGALDGPSCGEGSGDTACRNDGRRG